jgi:peptide/nickel transport system substrate-binding protein
LVVLKRNPYYRGSRDHHLDSLVIQVGDDFDTWTRKVEAGTADVDLGVPIDRLDDLAARYRVNKQRLFSVPSANMFYLHMNTERPLFGKNPKLRRAVNFALDRSRMLSALGPAWSGSVTDDYLPPGTPGYVDAHVYPLTHPNLTKAKALARDNTRSGKAVMYTCSLIITACQEEAQIVKADLKEIGIDVEIKSATVVMSAIRGAPVDLSFRRFAVPWVDPYHYVNRLLDGRTTRPTENVNSSYFNSTHYNTLIDRAGRLTGRARHDAYSKIAVDIARDAAPMAAVFVRNTRFFVSSRVGCVRASAHGLDLAGLCLR